MDKFKETTNVIDKAINTGLLSSVDMLEATMQIDNNKGPIKGRLVSYIIENHMDEEMEMHLQDTMGYDADLHRMQVDPQGNISF